MPALLAPSLSRLATASSPPSEWGEEIKQRTAEGRWALLTLGVDRGSQEVLESDPTWGHRLLSCVRSVGDPTWVPQVPVITVGRGQCCLL